MRRPHPRRSMHRWVYLLGVALACMLVVDPPRADAVTVGTGACAQQVDIATGVTVTLSGSNCVVTFAYRGGPFTWTLPGHDSMNFSISGGGSGRGPSDQRYRERGAGFQGTLTGLSAFGSAYIRVGAGGTANSAGQYGAGGWGGSVGGQGGSNTSYGGSGSTDVLLGGTGSANRVLVAGGGGGYSGNSTQTAPGNDANGATGGPAGAFAHTGNCSWTITGGSNAASGGNGGWNNARQTGGGGGGYAGGGSGGYLFNYPDPNFCSQNEAGGTGGRGSSYADPAYATITDSSVGKWSSGTGGVSGTNTDYSMYTNGGNGTVVFTFPARMVTITTQPPANATSGVTLTGPVTIDLDDAGAPPAAGTVVTASIATSPAGQGSGLPTLSGTTTATTDANGVATFNNLVINGKVGAYTLSFTSSGYPSATTSTVTLAASSIVNAGRSSIATAAATLTAAAPSPTTTVTVQAKDSGGNTITTGGATVALSASAGSIGAVTDNGDGTYSATFTAPQTAGPVTISGTVDGSAITDPATVTVNPATAAALAMTTQPAAGSAYSGQALGTQPVVRVVDAFGNTVTGATNAITAAVVTVSGSTGSLGGTATQNATAGVVSFSGLSVTGTATSSYRLRFTATGLTSVDSDAFALARAPQSITFSYTGGAKVVGDAPYTTSATSGSGLVVAFSGTPGVCAAGGNASTIAGVSYATITILGTGTCTITATQAGDDDYLAASPVPQSFTVTRGTQPTLTISSATAARYGDTITLAAIGGAGTGAVTYALTTPGVCTLSSGVLSFSGVGTCAVQATKQQDANYLQAQSASTTITVTQAAQTVAFTSQPPLTPLPNGAYPVVATASSGLPVSLTLVQGGGTACQLSAATSPATITFLATGTCEVRASNAGDANYLAADVSPTQVISVGALNQAITFATPSARAYGSPAFGLTATSSSGLSPSFTSQTTSVCTTTAAGVVSIVSVGTCTITASQAGNAQYAAASPVPRSFAIEAVTATAPHVQSASAGDEAITVSIAPPGFDGGAAITGWRLVATPTSGPAVTSDACTDMTAPIVCSIAGLDNGTAYTVTAAGINAAGAGSASQAAGPLTPATAAMAVTGAYAVPDDGSVTVGWDAIPNGALGGGTFVRYDIYEREAGSAWPGTATATIGTESTASYQFTGLQNGTSYDYKIVVITSANATEMSGNTTVVSEYASTVPSAPTDLTLTPTGPTSMMISWAAPTSNGGALVTSYTPVITPSATCGAVTVDNATGAAWCEVTGLAFSTAYSVSVRAANRMGPGSDAAGTHTTSADPTPPTSPDDGSSGGGSNGAPGAPGGTGTDGGTAASSNRLVAMSRARQVNRPRSITLITRVRVTGSGRLTQKARAIAPGTQGAPARAGRRAPSRLGAVLCSARRVAPRAGTYTIRCVLSRPAAVRLSKRSMRARLTTTFRAADGRVTTRSAVVLLRRAPSVLGPEAVTG